MNQIRPFIKWAGGKRQLLNEISKRMPKSFNNFFEPFAGGAALSLHINKKNTVINDICKELIESYLCIKENPKKLIKILNKHQRKHQINPEKYYYKIRSLEKNKGWIKKNKFVKSARFIYLNKACYNGLHRINSQGYFNVPWNGKLKVKLYEKDNINNLSSFLKNNKIMNVDFEEAIKEAKKGDFIFFDPPYDVLNKNTFDSYNTKPFGVHGQKRLSKIAHELSEKGCYVMITNHNTKLINELYKDFKIDTVIINRFVNSNVKKRIAEETIIYNY